MKQLARRQLANPTSRVFQGLSDILGQTAIQVSGNPYGTVRICRHRGRQGKRRSGPVEGERWVGRSIGVLFRHTLERGRLKAIFSQQSIDFRAMPTGELCSPGHVPPRRREKLHKVSPFEDCPRLCKPH
jgi:hypothetical protein